MMHTDSICNGNGNIQHTLASAGNPEQHRESNDSTQDEEDTFLDVLADTSEASVDNLSQLAGALLTEFDLPALDVFHEALDDLQQNKKEYASPRVIVDAKAAEQANARHAKRLRTRNQLLYLLFTFDLWVTTYWIAKYPSTISHSYTAQTVLLFVIRWVDWKRKKWHYYMFDWCYMGNFIIVAGLTLAPGNVKVVKACFAYALGPLAWSIIPFGNSLVYHSVEKFTTLFLHLYPACTLWAIRWYPHCQMAATLAADSDSMFQWEAASVADLILVPMLPYLLWATLYFAKIFIISPERIRLRGYHTLYNWVTSRPGLFNRIISKAPTHLQPLTYMLLHMCNAAWSMALCCIWWRSFWASSFFVLGMFLVGVWNGSRFYVTDAASKRKA